MSTGMTDDSKNSAGDDRTHLGVVIPHAPAPRPQPDRSKDASPVASEVADKTQVFSPSGPPQVAPKVAAAETDDRTQRMGGAPVLPGPESGDSTRVMTMGVPPRARPPIPAEAPNPAEAIVAAKTAFATPSVPSPVDVGAPFVSPPVSAPTTASAPSAAAVATVATAVAVSAVGNLDDDGDRTVVLRRSEPKFALVHTGTEAGASERVRLDRPRMVLGRGHGVDVKLRSPTASREHARIEEEAGTWFVEGFEGKSVYVDEALVENRIELQVGMRIRLGDDEFLVASADGVVVAAREEAKTDGLFTKLRLWWKDFWNRL